MSIWTVTSAAAYRDQMRSDLDLEAGTALQYDGSLAGAYTAAAAELAYRVDSGFSSAINNLLLASADRAVVVARAISAGLTPRAATFSRYIAQVEGAGTLPTGTLFQGGGTDGRARWEVVDDTAVVADGDDITLQAVDSGAVTMPAGVTSLSLVTPVTGITGAEYDSAGGDPFQIGSPAESVGSLRVRTDQARSNGGSYTSAAAAVRNLSWVTAVDVRQGSAAGTVRYTVVPAPVGADQEAELGAAIYAATAAGATLEGASSVTAVDVNGDTVSIPYTTGATQAVAVVVSVTSDGSVADADLADTIAASVRAYFEGLAPGDTAFFTRFTSAALSPDAVIGTVSLTLDGGVVDVSPTLATDLLIPSPLTVTVTT